MERRFRVLLIAEAANPEWPSVPLVGWSLAKALAKVADTHLVTNIRNREAILRAGLTEGEDFTAIDNERVAGPVWRLANKLRGGEGVGWTTISAFESISYYAFENLVWKKFGARLAAGDFDLVHRITPLTPTHQSLIARKLQRLGVPFVIGPLNGGVPWPKSFMDRQHAEKEWLAHVRGAYKLMPGYKSTIRCSSAIMAGSMYTLNAFPGWAKDKCIYIPENGVDLERFSRIRTHAASLPLRAAFVGRLVPYKGADILLEAAAGFLSDGSLKLDIIGDGPERGALEKLANDLGVSRHIEFHGWVPHPEVQTILVNSDFMALPSVREFGGGVVLEAMALGVTPIVANYAGPSELVDDETGIRVDFSDKPSLIEGMKRAMARVIREPETLDRLGAAGREAVLAKFTWEAKAEQVLKVYGSVLTNGRVEANLSVM